MKIFVLLSRIPYPLEKGDKLRAFNQIKELSKSNTIILCTLNPDAKVDKQKAFSELQPYCQSVNFIDLSLLSRMWNMTKAFFSTLPIQVGYFYSCKAAKEIKKLIATHNPDHIYCQFIRTTKYLEDINIKKTLDYQDALSYGLKRRLDNASFFEKPFFKLEYNRVLNYENLVFDKFDNKTIISIPDKNLIQHKRKNEIHVIPNGVDHSFFKPINCKKTVDIVFTGNMAYPPNVDAAEYLVNKIMPIVWQTIPNATVMLAGASPVKKVLALQSNLVKVSGWMDDIRDSYSAANVFIAPMRIGTGLQNKLLEAMSMKIPTITTPLANDALQAGVGHDILIGENTNELANCITKVLNSNKLRDFVSQKGYDFVQNHHSWEKATQKLNKIINNS